MRRMTGRRNTRVRTVSVAAILLLMGTVAAAASGDSGGGNDPQQAAERAARDVARTEDRADRATAEALDRASHAASDAEQRAMRDAATTVERSAQIEQRFVEEQAKVSADAASDPVKAAEDLAKAEADRQNSLDQLAESTSGSGTSGSSGSGSSGSGSSGSGSSGSESSNSGSDSSGSGSDGGSSTSMRELARDEIPEFDLRGFPVRRGEVVALDLTEAALAQARTEGFRLVARDRLEALSATVTRLDTPPGLESEAALARLRSLDPGATFDYTHYYGLQISPQGGANKASGAAMHRQAGRLTVGMIDTAVASHPVLAGTAVTQRRFGATSTGSPQFQHGTAVASILATGGSRKLLVADVFRGSAAAPFTSADAIAQSLEWMAANNIAVVNISLAGPRNAILDRLIERASARGMVIVAAAGNGGPTAPPAYPAALGSVVAVTAVDAQSRIYRYANQGAYIAVAARGVSEPAANSGGGIGSYSGTSFATPHIAVWLARCLGQKHASPQLCRERLRIAARDAGAMGRDPVYGWGIIDAN